MEQEQHSQLNNIKNNFNDQFDKSLGSDSMSNNSTNHKAKLSSIPSLLKKSFIIYKNSFWKFTMFLLFPVVGMSALVVAWLTYVNFRTSVGESSTVTTNIVSILLILIIITAFVFFAYVSFIAQGAIFILISNGINKMSIRETLLGAKKHILGLVVVNFSIILFTFLWGLLFIIPGFIAIVFYSFASWSFLREGFKGTATLKRSRELIKNYWWSVLIRVFGLFFAFFIILFLPLAEMDLLNDKYIWSNLLKVVIYISIPFFTIISNLTYMELQKIKGESNIKQTNSTHPIFLTITVTFFATAFLLSLFILSLKNSEDGISDKRIVSRANLFRESVTLYFIQHGTLPDNLAIPEGLSDYKITERGFEICFQVKNDVDIYRKGKNCLHSGQ